MKDNVIQLSDYTEAEEACPPHEFKEHWATPGKCGTCLRVASDYIHEPTRAKAYWEPKGE